MKILITHQFNQAMLNLRPNEQQEVSQLFSIVSNLEKSEVLDSALLTRITSKAENIYTLRGQSVRIFCTFDADENMLFLDVASAGPPQFLNTEIDEDETTLFGAKGDPKAYIARDEENTIYSFNGKPLAYVDENSNIYGFNGKHLGWFEDGIVWDHQGKRVGFTKRTSSIFTQFEPFKGFKQFKPFRAFKQYAPYKPFKAMSTSSFNLLDFLEKGR